MKKINFKRAGQIVIALFFVFVFYAGYLFMMDREWYSTERYASQFFEEGLSEVPTLTVTDVSGGFFSWRRTIELSDGTKVFFHRSCTPSAWKLVPGQKIAVWVSLGDLEKEKSSYFCGAYEKR